MTAPRPIPYTAFTTVPTEYSYERTVYHPEHGRLGLIVKISGGWGTMDGLNWATQRGAAEHLLRKADRKRGDAS